MKPFVYETIARFSDTDLYGVVHHSNYFRWLEEARMQMLEDILELSLEYFEEQQIIIPVISLESKFIKPVLARQKVKVYLQFIYTGTAKLIFLYQIKNENEKVIFHGKTEHVLVKDGKMLFTLPSELNQIILEKIEIYKDIFVVTPKE